MFLHLACLPLAAVLINDVRTESSDGAITVDVATSEPVELSDVRSVSGGLRRMFVYLQGAQPSRKAFGSGSGSVVAYPRARYTKLEIPTDGRCAEPMTVESIPAGIRVRASCRDNGVLSLAVPVRLPSKEHAEQPSPDAPMAARARSRSQSESLRAALALPAEATDKESDGMPADDSGHGAAAVEPSDKNVQAAATVPADLEKVVESPTANTGKPAVLGKAAPPAPTMQPDAPLAAVASSESASPSGYVGGGGKSSSSSVSTVLAALVLVGLGVAATFLARRRATRVRMIRIVETASIGPRRSLVVACIGGRTMVLGVSEAGVSLLDAQPGPISIPASLEKTPSATLEEAMLGVSQGCPETSAETTEEAKHEGSLLSRLFHHVRPPSSEDRRAHEFDELLAESLEDQDLRQKLSMGEAGRVA